MWLRRCTHGRRVCLGWESALAMLVVRMTMKGDGLGIATKLRVSVGSEES